MWYWPDVSFHSNIGNFTSACARVCVIDGGIIAFPGVTFARSAYNATVAVVVTTCHTAAIQHLCTLVIAVHGSLQTRQVP